MRQLAVFAKYWRPGHVKTRLAAAIGADAASRIARELVCLAVRRLRAVADRRSIVFTPAEHQREFEELAGSGWQCLPQTTGDLGDRLRAHFDAAFREGAERVVVLGTDSPTLPLSYVEQAFEVLHHQAVVLGPTEDGGYYLIGAAQRTPDVFHEIPWSTSAVWSRTTARLEALGVAFASLPAWYDIDHGSDLDKLRGELSRPAFAGDEFEPLRQLVAEIGGQAS